MAPIAALMTGVRKPLAAAPGEHHDELPDLSKYGVRGGTRPLRTHLPPAKTHRAQVVVHVRACLLPPCGPESAVHCGVSGVLTTAFAGPSVSTVATVSVKFRIATGAGF